MKLISVTSRGNRLARVIETVIHKESWNFCVYGKEIRCNKYEGVVCSCELLFAGVTKAKALKAADEWLTGAQE